MSDKPNENDAYLDMRRRAYFYGWEAYQRYYWFTPSAYNRAFNKQDLIKKPAPTSGRTEASE